MYPILGLSRPLSIFPWSILSFEDPQVVTGGYSRPRNKHWHSWYIVYKIWYIFHKIWYILKNIWHIQSLSYPNLYFITHGPFIPLGIFGKWLEVVPYFEMNFGTLGISLRKFDTSNPWANETPISFPIVHFFPWRPLESDWRSVPTLKWAIAPLVYPLQNLVHPS